MKWKVTTVHIIDADTEEEAMLKKDRLVFTDDYNLQIREIFAKRTSDEELQREYEAW